MVTFVFWFRTHTEFKSSPGQYFPFPPLRQLIYEQLENVLCRGCGFTSQRYPSITPFIREIRTHAVCQWKGRSRWRRISPRRSAERSQTPLLWFWHSDTGCGGERGSDTHFHSVQLWCNNSTGFTGVFAVVTAWSCKILSGSWNFAAGGGGGEEWHPGSQLWKIHDGRVTFICLMCYITLHVLMICNPLPDSWDVNLLDAVTAGSGGKSLITFTKVLYK